MAKINRSSSLYAVIVLVLICFVCVALLALLNDLLYVSDDVRFSRAMAAIYSGVEFAPASDEKEATYISGSAKHIASATENDARVEVIEATGNGGHSQGTVTLYVVVRQEGDAATIAAWSIKSNVGQDYIGKIDGANKWYVGADIANDVVMDTNYTSGATETSTAINNAVNNAARYARETLEMGSNPEKDEFDALIAKLAEEVDAKYADVTEYTRLNEGANFFGHLSTEDAALTYLFEISIDGETQYALVYTIDGALEELVIVPSVTDSVRQSVVYTSAGIPDELVAAVTANAFDDYAYITDVKEEGGNVVYTVVGKKRGYRPDAYTFEITVNADGEIAKFDIITDGYVGPDYAPPIEDTHRASTAIVGKKLADLDTFLVKGETYMSNATNSANIILSSAKLALEHYEANYGGNA